MRLVLELQSAQCENRFRGIGRYTLSFAQAVVRNRGEHEVILALSGLFPDSIEPIRAAFDGLLPQENIRVWDAPPPARDSDPANRMRREAAERIREAFLASINPDVIHIGSLFEGFVDDAVTSIGLFDHTTPVSVTLYDLIPLIYRHPYLQNPVFERWYLRKIDHLRRAKLLLAISASSGREAIEYLGFDPAVVVSVGSDCDARFRPIGMTEAQWLRMLSAYQIKHPFVMYTGGIDHRKNIERLIQAYASLPLTLRRQHQLVVVCAIQPADRERLLLVARQAGLQPGELVLTGFVPDDDLLALYNACTLFVFPSWHEGFGLPVLEAMRCGRAVIASNTSSLPEVVGREDALFDPFDVSSIAHKMEQVLSDDAFRAELERHGLEQAKAFSFDESARCAWAAWEALEKPRRAPSLPTHRPRLAYVSPLPPERTGIADYSTELLPELSRWYEVDVIVAQSEVSDAYIRANCRIRSVAEFRADAASYQRVLYHFGNSPFHQHMFALLEEISGVVVLHDFFLSGIQEHRDVHGGVTHAWARALQSSHGYVAVAERYMAEDTAEVAWRYPANLPVLQSALGVIVHSEYSRTLARQWYGSETAADWAVIPHLRTPALGMDREMARQALGLVPDDLLVCSFGLLGPTKLNHQLLAAWLASPLAKDHKAHLVFVGENHGGDYGQQLLRTIKTSGFAERIRITGWVDAETFRRYLTAADIGVQLRTLSRGETSGTVLDCMNHGLATIVNAHGSLADLDEAGVWMLADAFADEDMTLALTTLARDVERRRALGARAREIIRTRHAPRRCAEQYAQAIEGFYQRAQAELPGLLTSLLDLQPTEPEWSGLAASLARNFPPSPRRRQLLVDVSELVQRDVKTGIQRVVRAILQEWLDRPPEGFQVEPVYATTDAPGYRYARRWTSRFLGIPDDWAEDAPVEAWTGDLFVGLDLQSHVVPVQESALQAWRARGVGVWFVVYDLLLLMLPQAFTAGAQAVHQRWLETISRFDGVACISRAVADELSDWLAAHSPRRERPLVIKWFHLGADVRSSVPSTGLPADAEQVLAKLSGRPSFLMVGTIEPRKGHAQVLDAFEQIWQRGGDLNIVIVGKQGWMVEKLVERLRSHPQLNQRLFWLEGISDEYLEKIYTASTCLIAASYGEGFGLPLIEAAQHKLPIIARDIPVFREVAGKYAFYFDAQTAEALAHAIQVWLGLYQANQHPKSDDMPWLTWKESAEQLWTTISTNKPYKHWMPDAVLRYWGNDPRLLTEVGERSGKEMRSSGKSGFLLFGPYATLKAGCYHLTVTGTASFATGKEWLDVTYNQGETQLLCTKLPIDDSEAWQFMGSFTLTKDVDDLEVRIWVDAQSVLAVTGYEIQSTSVLIQISSQPVLEGAK